MPAGGAPAANTAATLPADQKSDYDQAEKLKSEGNTLFKEQKYDEAC